MGVSLKGIKSRVRRRLWSEEGKKGPRGEWTTKESKTKGKGCQCI